MKKFIALILVLAMASVAQAGLFLSVDGVQAPDTIYLTPSATVMLDIMVGPEQNITGGTFEIVLSNAQAELLHDNMTFPDNGEFGFFPFYKLSSSAQHVEVTGGGLTPVDGPLTIVDNVILHCLDETDVIIDLHATGIVTVDGVSYQASHIFDTITVVQPEPATIALLGLGGVALLRRRRK